MLSAWFGNFVAQSCKSVNQLLRSHDSRLPSRASIARITAPNGKCAFAPKVKSVTVNWRKGPNFWGAINRINEESGDACFKQVSGSGRELHAARQLCLHGHRLRTLVDPHPAVGLRHGGIKDTHPTRACRASLRIDDFLALVVVNVEVNGT